MSLDPETFRTEAGHVRWRFYTTDRLGQFDIAVPADEKLNPDASALLHLEAALAQVDTLYDEALLAAEAGWQARYNAPLRDRAAWSLVRLFADRTGQLVLTLQEGEFDTYCVWDVTFAGGKPALTKQRPYGAGASPG